MDGSAANLQIKKTKLENSLSELNNEILMSFNFLQRIKKHSAEIVRDLNNITTPAIYFKGFVDVNSCILKYLSLLTEVNCKFEILGISGNSDSNSVSVSGNTASDKEVSDKLDSCTSFHGNEDTSEQPAESSSLLVINVKPSNGLENVKCEVKSTKKNNSNNSQISNSDFGSNLQENSDRMDVSQGNFPSDVEKNYLKVITTNAEVGADRSLNEKMSDSEVSSSYINCSSPIDKVKLQAVDKESSAPLTESANTTICKEVQQGKIHSSKVDIPVAEVVPTKAVEYNCGTEMFKDVKPLQISDANSETPILRRGEESKNEDGIRSINISRKVGDEYEIMIEQIHSPSEFYVNIKGIQSDLFFALLQNSKISRIIKNKVWDKKYENRKTWLSEQLGSYVLCYSKCEEVWCRAKVISWCLNFKDDYIKIFLLDYGEYKCACIDDIEAMPEYFKRYPACAIRCHLYGIYPSDIDIDIDTHSWGKESTEMMKSLTEVSEKLKIRVAPEDNFHPESLPVLLWMVDKNNECVNELLVESKFAIYCFDTGLLNTKTGNELSEENEILKDWNPMREDFQAYENCYDLNINDPATYIYGYVGQDYERICRHFARTGYCFKGKACKKEHMKLDPLGFTTDQEEVYKNAFNSLSAPPVNSVVRVQITCLLGINNFCCVLDDRKLSKEEESLETLLEFMNEPENIKKMKKLLIPPSAGQIVIAQYSVDKCWYRAKILESQLEDDFYTVLFVDYGNKATVSLSQIRAIEDRYLHLPFQALTCYIFGIKQNPEIPLTDGMNYLNERISSGCTTIEIVSKLPGEDITLLVHLFDENGKNISEDLMTNNYAVPKEEMIISTESESLPG